MCASWLLNIITVRIYHAPYTKFWLCFIGIISSTLSVTLVSVPMEKCAHRLTYTPKLAIAGIFTHAEWNDLRVRKPFNLGYAAAPAVDHTVPPSGHSVVAMGVHKACYEGHHAG